MFAEPCGSAYAQVFFNCKIFKRLAAFENLNDALAGDKFRRLILNVDSIVDNCSFCYFAIFRFEQPGDGF